jgi:hypothetical protein
MAQPDRVCRTCSHYERGKGEHVKWPPRYGRCRIDAPEVPAHANSRACERYRHGYDRREEWE